MRLAAIAIEIIFVVFYALFSMHGLYECIVFHTLYAKRFVLCILCRVLYASYSMHCVLCILFYELYLIQYIQCIVSMHYILCILFFMLYSMQCILCILFYVLYNMDFMKQTGRRSFSNKAPSILQGVQIVPLREDIVGVLVVCTFYVVRNLAHGDG